MRFKYVLKDGTIVEGDQHIEQDGITHVIKTYIADLNYDNPEDCTYDIIVLKDEDITQRIFANVTYDELIDYLELVKKNNEQFDNSQCISCEDKDCDECDDYKPYMVSNLDDVRSYV